MVAVVRCVERPTSSGIPYTHPPGRISGPRPSGLVLMVAEPRNPMVNGALTGRLRMAPKHGCGLHGSNLQGCATPGALGLSTYRGLSLWATGPENRPPRASDYVYRRK